MNRLKGKVAIVTGGGKGIGRRICEVFAEEGAKVAVFARGENGKETEQSILTAGGIGKFHKVDVSSEAEVEAGVNAVIAEWGKVDILVNNAGTQSVDKLMHEITEEEWCKNFGVDVNGVFFCNKHCVKDMLKRNQGSIVNISSIQGLAGSYAELNFPYHACKSAVCGMTMQDACIYGKFGIRFNAVCPSAIDTPMVRNRLQPQSVFDEYMAGQAEMYPLRKIGDVDDVAYAALYLASDEAKFVTGINLPVDGGALAY